MQNNNQFLSAIAKYFILPQSVYIKVIIFTLELLLALPIGLILAKIVVGGIAWVFGGIAAGALILNCWRILFKSTVEPNKAARKVGQILVGTVIGFSIAHGNLIDIIPVLHIFVFIAFILLLSGVGIGYIYFRITQSNLLNCMLATVPGGVGIMSSIAADYNRNVALVALVQVIRVTSVILIIPIFARLSVGEFGQPSIDYVGKLFEIDFSDLQLLPLLVPIAFLVVTLAIYLQIPAAHFFGSLLVGLSFNYLIHLVPFISNADFNPPALVNVIGQALLGISIGEYWGNKPDLDKKTILYAFIPVTMTIGAGFIVAAIAKLLTPWDWLTCILVTAPGGSTEMILVALALNHNVEIVTAGHLVRLIAIYASLPLWLFLFRYLDNLVPQSSNN